MVMREHRLGFFRSCISVCHQQGRPFLASLELPVERIEAVYHGFELRRESEVIHWRGEYHHIGGHKVRTKQPKIVVEYTLTVHSATVAGDAGRNLVLGAIEMVHLVSGFFRTLDELSGQMIGIPVPARTSCQYYYFIFLSVLSFNNSAAFAIPTPESRVAPAAAPTVFMNFLLSVSVRLFH